MRRHFAVDFVIAALFLSIAGVGGSPAFAEQETTAVAFVEHVSGPVVAFSQGKPDSARDNGYYRSSNPVRSSTER